MPITPLEASLMMLATVEAVVAAFLMRREILLRRQAERVARESQESSVEIQRLAIEATVDPLTGLANRRWVLSESARGVREALENQSPYSLCLGDVDNLKNINDTYGHHAGDEVLKAVALAIRAELRGQDMPGRLGGDEFCALLPRTAAAQAQICVERIRRRLQAMAFADGEGRSYGVTATFGIAGLSPGMTETALFEAADQALYAAKRRSGNAIEVAV
jgi:diguanylate cyclase